MDLQKILYGVKSLNDYIAATEKVISKCENIKIHLNMSTVLNLKKVRSLEIEVNLIILIKETVCVTGTNVNVVNKLTDSCRVRTCTHLEFVQTFLSRLVSEVLQKHTYGLTGSFIFSILTNAKTSVPLFSCSSVCCHSLPPKHGLCLARN